ncbi:MAG: DUF6265 family protein [Caulobacteraceae bacterium]
MIAAALAAAAISADVSQLDWLAGTWSQAQDGGHVREMWLPPQDGAMAGVTLTTRPGRPPRAEYAKITREPAGLTYTAVVGAQPPTPFVQIPDADGRLVFENRAHDFPQRVFYRRCGADLCGGIEGTLDGKPRREEWRYTRQTR